MKNNIICRRYLTRKKLFLASCIISCLFFFSPKIHSQSQPNLAVWLVLNDPFGGMNYLYITKCLPQPGQVITTSYGQTYLMDIDTTVIINVWAGSIYTNLFTYSEPGYTVQATVDLTNISGPPQSFITYTVTNGNNTWYPSTFVIKPIPATFTSPCGGALEITGYGGSIPFGGNMYYIYSDNNSFLYGIIPNMGQNYLSTSINNLCPGTYGIVAYDDSLTTCPPTQSLLTATIDMFGCFFASNNTSCSYQCDGTTSLQWFPPNNNNPVIYQNTQGNSFTYLGPPPFTDSMLCGGTQVTGIVSHPWIGQYICLDSINSPLPLQINLNVNQNNASASAGGGTPPYNFNWYNSNNTLVAGNTNTVSNLPNGNYYVIVTDTMGCSDTASFTINATTIQTSSPEFIHLYPQPAHDNLYIVAPSFEGKIILMSMDGKILQQQTVRSQSLHILSLSDLPAGFYFISLQSQQSASITKKLIKE